ncbi:hypothetical protein Z517_10578 [Fonsecaea pedrosoi CBS 271.37]|uniref:Unplaced genomic scaffold supercont1.7, whole genome shotgun sequence n=1 Tax=Fonsecaea pedrosoi CBS 271.37 TaxID=1442368 RepID=A0A0D2G555_9EURO|nr:uncharacterized protein Z517_10578 [Fonsecaea pedrosoi CBS 271.37]KIW75833.1 hypothetical protein Z517_10578 [Fonsecaea pedrosoi CBS 271.37]
MPVSPSFTVSSIDTWVSLKQLLRKLMEKEHVFIPASSPHMHYVGRWMPTSNQLRRDAAFPGSYVEMVIANTTGLSLSLNNLNSASKQQPELLGARDIHHSEFRSIGARASDPVNLVVSVEGHNTYWVEAAGMVVSVTKHLDQQKTYRVKLTHMGGPHGTNGALEFEGIWLDKAAPAEASTVSSTLTETSSLPRLLPLREDHLDNTSLNGEYMHRRSRKVVEIVTSDGSLSLMNHLPPISGSDVDKGVDNWHKGLDAVVLDMGRIGLLPTGESGLTLRDQFFRAGPLGTKAFSRPWNFKLYRPSVLVLQLGSVDFGAFFSSVATEKPVSKHALAKFTNEFIEVYINLIQAIRANAYPFNPAATGPTSDLGDDDNDGSYIYNSAPSTLSIFLLTPFSALRYPITKKLKLDRVISYAVAQVVSTLQSQGDKSTFWIDTSGWLDVATDFDSDLASSNSSEQLSSPPSSSVLNRSGMIKVTTLLADHLCPYIGPSSATGSSVTEDPCPFDKYDNYLGNVYLPTDVDFDRALLEHKIELIKQRFNL